MRVPQQHGTGARGRVPARLPEHCCCRCLSPIGASARACGAETRRGVQANLFAGSALLSKASIAPRDEAERLRSAHRELMLSAVACAAQAYGSRRGVARVRDKALERITEALRQLERQGVLGLQLDRRNAEAQRMKISG